MALTLMAFQSLVETDMVDLVGLLLSNVLRVDLGGHLTEWSFDALSPHAALHGTRPYYGPYGQLPRPSVGHGPSHALGCSQGDLYDGVGQSNVAGHFSKPSGPPAPPDGPARGAPRPADVSIASGSNAKCSCHGDSVQGESFKAQGFNRKGC
ncbi:hypothetical protein GOBAR_AA21569 [Gossypium barbadense]|uniref:Uncharacterized protein n=1 Tax=Gossypium barbadense TaxID=3634 RepID=A0A2P5X6Y9_GOSBA|nr:hypothetical protein GOBAR_AA21569 [Gossypium barbadense]